MNISRFLLWLLVVLLGIEIGAGIYEARVLVPLWSAAPPESLVTYNLQSLRPNPGMNFWIVSTPLVGLLSLANLIVAFRSGKRARKWWVTGAGLAFVMVMATFIYFVPALQRFEALRQPNSGEIAVQVHQWVILNWVRAGIYLAAWLCLLRAFSASSAGEKV
jgi:hypothetical protein